MLLIKTVSGAEFRIPVSDIASITEIEPESGEARDTPAHPYLHREGVTRCAACWRPPADKSHIDHAIEA